MKMIKWVGGKCILSDWIIDHFHKDYTKMNYVEVFGGAGWVLFKKDRSRLEVYNDINGNLVNLFRVIRDNYDEFKEKCIWTLHSREMWKESYENIKNNKFENDIDRALHTSIMYVQSFSGFGHSWSFNTSDSGRLDWERFIGRLSKIRDRLKGVQIENLDFTECIKKYDNENTLFYLDPPYILDGNEYYKSDFTLKDHKNLRNLLMEIDGKFILSYYPTDEILDWYSDYNIFYKETKKWCQKKSKKDNAIEILITNYEEKDMLKNNKQLNILRWFNDNNR